jgi:endonuclease VIII
MRMPEGDTIFRTATVLRAALVGRRVTAARAQPRPGVRRVPDMGRVVGASVERVEPRGKHLLIGFDNGLTLRTHLRMRGSWHRYAPGEPWRRRASAATVVLETPESVAVCFDAPSIDLLTDADLPRHRPLRVGPDLLAPGFDTEEAVRRLRERGHMTIGEALLDQRAVAGIGNVVKNEVLFLARVDPWRRVAEVDDDVLRRLLATARRVLAANARGGRRVTTGVRAAGGELWVYGRAGRPCRRCGTRIEMRRQGELARSTYRCPRCQG